MPRKHDPIAVQVIRYFETAELAAAVLVLQLGKAAIEKRQPKPKLARVTAATPPPIVMPDPKAPPPAVSAAKPRTRRMHAAPSSQEQDVPLPGLPGPVPVVGG